MLPKNIGDIGEDITSLDLSIMGLIGKCVYPDLYLHENQLSGTYPRIQIYAL
jgi:hypothetical protein